MGGNNKKFLLSELKVKHLKKSSSENQFIFYIKI